MLNRRALLAFASLMVSGPARALDGAPAEIAKGVTFFYLGAKDCPYCQAFMRDSFAELKQRTEDAGIRFVAMETASLRDLHKPGVFGQWNPVWLKMVRRAGAGVPAFGLVDSGAFIDAHAGEWEMLLVKAIARAEKLKAAAQ